MDWHHLKRCVGELEEVHGDVLRIVEDPWWQEQGLTPPRTRPKKFEKDYRVRLRAHGLDPEDYQSILESFADLKHVAEQRKAGTLPDGPDEHGQFWYDGRAYLLTEFGDNGSLLLKYVWQNQPVDLIDIAHDVFGCEETKTNTIDKTKDRLNHRMKSVGLPLFLAKARSRYSLKRRVT